MASRVIGVKFPSPSIEPDSIKWLPYKIQIKQKGFLDWRWEVTNENGYFVESGYALSKRVAIRRAKRRRKGTIG